MVRSTSPPWGEVKKSASNLVLAMRFAPESSSRAPNKATNASALRTDLRQRTPAVDTGILTIRASSIPKNERKKARKRNAERRVSNLRTSQTSLRSLRKPSAGCGARRALRARLSASHHGTCCSERTPQLNPSYALPGTGLGRSGCYPLPAVLQCSGLQTADRSSCRPGVYARVARVRR